jgi:hypothetical protein
VTPVPSWLASIRSWLHHHLWALLIGLAVGAVVIAAAALRSIVYLVAAAIIVVGIAAWSYGRHRAAWGDAIAVLTVAGLLLGIYLGALSLLQVDEHDRVGDSPGACILAGAGQPAYQQAFMTAFNRAGGRAALGCGTNLATHWGDGISQNFHSARGDSVITAVSPDVAYVLTPEFTSCITQAVRGAETLPTAGYPRGEPERVRGGWEIQLGAGTVADKGAQVVLRKGSGTCRWVMTPIWERYRELGGPAGPYGFPTSDLRAWNDGERQDFERGWLFYSPTRGVLTAAEFAAGATPTRPPTGPPASTPAPAATTPPVTRSARSSYNVNGDSHNGALSIVVRARGHVTQQFIAATPTVTWAGVIVGCDPGLTPSCGPDGSSFGPLDIQILDNTRVLATARVDTVNNRTSEGPLKPQANLTPGQTYVLRVVNATGKPAGFYFNQNSNPQLDTTISGAYHTANNGPNNLDLSALIDNR